MAGREAFGTQWVGMLAVLRAAAFPLELLAGTARFRQAIKSPHSENEQLEQGFDTERLHQTSSRKSLGDGMTAFAVRLKIQCPRPISLLDIEVC